MVLAEEGVEYRSRGTDIHAAPEQVSPWYVRINPNCNVPTLIHRHGCQMAIARFLDRICLALRA